MDNQPKGMGLYLRRLREKKHGKPEELAEQLTDHKVSWVAIGGPWHDRKGPRFINNPATIATYGDALNAAGVAVHVWGYPWHSTIAKFETDMRRCSPPSVSGWLLDPELGLKGHFDEARRLTVESRTYCTDHRLALGWTSYGLIAGHEKGRRAFPTDAFAGCDYASPQLYTIGPQAVETGIDQYIRRGWGARIVPSFGCYRWKGSPRRAVSKSASELHDHLSAFIDHQEPIDAMIGWSYELLGMGGWKTISRWAEWLERGACMLNPAVRP